MSSKFIVGVYPYEKDNTMGLPKDPNAYQMDENLYDHWVSANRPEYNAALGELKRKITHISYPAFKDSLRETVESFLKNREKLRRFHYVALVQPGKSQKWVTEIAITMGLKAASYVCLGEEGANNLEYALTQSVDKENRFQHYVIVDDGSFSGNQMANNISAAHRILKVKFAIQPIFHILIPYTTKTAQEKIVSLKEKGINVNLYTSTRMPLVTEAVSKQNLSQVLKVLWPHLGKEEQTRMGHSTALYWFDHKMPNSMSFPIVLAEGQVTQPKNAKNVNTFAFLPQVQPPYKG